MKQYQAFIIDSYAFDPEKGVITLNYSLDDEVRFTEKLLLREGVSTTGIDHDAFEASLFALHIIGGISYYKTCLPKRIEVRSGGLTKNQAAFWESVYENGLGEFFYRNSIDFRGLVQFPVSESLIDAKPAERARAPRDKKNMLIPIGGGKDSVVTAELIKKAQLPATLFRLGHHPFITALSDTLGMPLLTVERHLSPALFRLNEEGALNGHVPITAYLSFLTITLSLLHDFDAIAMSNERSANEGNVEFHGKEINHQWSKSLDFERAFQEYVKTYITPDKEYFSLLRPMSELSIAKIFAAYPQYFEQTTSCNTNWRIVKEKPKERWCGVCPKCAFAYCLFSAYIDARTLETMFGKNLYADPSLMPLYRELLGLQGQKPFECVGTPDETKAAMLLAHRRGDLNDTPVMQMFIHDVLPTIKDPDALLKNVESLSDDHAIPGDFRSIL